MDIAEDQLSEMMIMTTHTRSHLTLSQPQWWHHRGAAAPPLTAVLLRMAPLC